MRKGDTMKKKELYLENGFLNAEAVFRLKESVVFMLGGRGIGKTYGLLEYVYKNGLKFLYLRRTQAQTDALSKEAMNPYKSINRNNGWDIRTAKTGYKGMYTFVDENSGEVVGYMASVSTFSNLRGFDASDIAVIILDEFIPELHERAIRGEAEAVFNLMETVIRERDVEGTYKKTIFVSNSVNTANPIFIYLGIVSKVMKLSQTNEFYLPIPERGCCVLMPKDSPVSARKKESGTLYKLTNGTAFENEAIGNQFAHEEISENVISRNLKNYRAEVSVGELTVYSSKIRNGWYYCSEHRSGAPNVYSTSTKSLEIFRRKYGKYGFIIASGKMEYENYTCEVLLDKYLNFY